MNGVVRRGSKDSVAKVVYILYLLSIAIVFTGWVGVALAYAHRGDAADWMKSHYRFQIRTFWIGLVLLATAALLLALLPVPWAGLLMLPIWSVWLIGRCVQGISALDRHVAHPDPGRWIF